MSSHPYLTTPLFICSTAHEPSEHSAPLFFHNFVGVFLIKSSVLTNHIRAKVNAVPAILLIRRLQLELHLVFMLFACLLSSTNKNKFQTFSIWHCSAFYLFQLVRKTQVQTIVRVWTSLYNHICHFAQPCGKMLGRNSLQVCFSWVTQ